MLARCSAIRSGEARSDFVAIATRLGLLGSAASSPTRYRSPGPMRWSAGRHTPTTSTCDQVARTTSLSRSPSRVRGLCKPGVSINTSWASGRCTMPRTACRVVCGFEEAITIFWPTSALVSVDLPALGRPTKQAKPERISLRLCARVVRGPSAARSSDRTVPRRSAHQTVTPSPGQIAENLEVLGSSAPARRATASGLDAAGTG